MLLYRIFLVLLLFEFIDGVQFPLNPIFDTSLSADDRSTNKENNKTLDQSDQDVSRGSHEMDIENSNEETKDKKFLHDAMTTILDPSSIIIDKKIDGSDSYKDRLDEIDRKNITLQSFMTKMDNLSLDICKKFQEALWYYVTDVQNNFKKNKMIKIATEEDEIKRRYWNILKKKYLNDDFSTNSEIKRKIRIIKERETLVQMPQSKEREVVDEMQRIWSRATVCSYNTTVCSKDTARTMNDIITIFKTSNDSEELRYYWKGYRDETGKKIRPIFKEYVDSINAVAESENFTDAGELWRNTFEDDDFLKTVDRIWTEVKPLYNLLQEYVRNKLKYHYKNELKTNEKLIPAHILGNIWAQDWQALYPKLVLYPNHPRIIDPDESINSKDIFDAVDQFYESIGFESAKDSYEGIENTITTSNCIPSSHDMCDGIHYKIKWCGENITDLAIGLSRAARLLGHVQYYKSYRNLPFLYRDGPTPAFHDALADIIANQLITPDHLKLLNLGKVETGVEVSINHLLWLALEKIPLMAYAYTLDKWRWNVFSNKTLQNWNRHWWDLRIIETKVSPPIPRNESDLDPASKYHVVANTQYITYLISPIIEFQILTSLCKAANHTGPLHECSIYGVKEAGNILRNGMSLGSSVDWRTVLRTMTGEDTLSTKGILDYFAALKEVLQKENMKLNSMTEDAYVSAPIIVGILLLVLTLFILVIYFTRKHNITRILLCGFGKNGSLDIVTNENMSPSRDDEVIEIVEERV